MSWKTGDTASQMMTTRLKVLRPNDRVFDAVKMLLKNKISGAPVVDDNYNLIGILSEKDAIHVLLRAVTHHVGPSLVKDAMTTDLITVTEDAHLLTIAHLFVSNPVRRLPVVRGTKLVGQISRRDLIRSAVQLFDTAPDRPSALLYLSALDQAAPM